MSEKNPTDNTTFHKATKDNTPPLSSIKKSFSEERDFLDFVNEIRSKYKPIPDKNIFPKILQVQSSSGVGYLQVDLKGHLYFKSEVKTEDIPAKDANAYSQLIYQNQHKLELLEKGEANAS
jgi:hypothetical protein